MVRYFTIKYKPLLFAYWGGNLQNTVLSVRYPGTFALVWTPTGFNAHPDPAFFLTADQDPDPRAKPMRIRADRIQVVWLCRQNKSWLLKWKIYRYFLKVLGQKIPVPTYVGSRYGKKVFILPRYISWLCQFHGFWIRNRIPNTDPDTDPQHFFAPCQYGTLSH